MLFRSLRYEPGFDTNKDKKDEGDEEDDPGVYKQAAARDGKAEEGKKTRPVWGSDNRPGSALQKPVSVPGPVQPTGQPTAPSAQPKAISVWGSV